MKPTSGRYLMLGQDLITAKDAVLTEFRNRHIGFVFQFQNLLPDFTTLEHVIFPTAMREGRETASARASMNCEEGTPFLISTQDERIANLCLRQLVVGDGLVTG
jgi:predicted ABC-type transport system involved in lysophospholipase L1 biosynthesis ATPase subunit